MKDSCLVAIFLFCLCLVTNVYSVSSDTHPDPHVLLNGVASVRNSVPPSSLKIRHTWSDSVHSATNYYDVDFDHEIRRFESTSDNGTWGIYEGIYDGNRVKLYDKSTPRVILYNVTDVGKTELLFDPRILGGLNINVWAENAAMFNINTNDFKLYNMGVNRINNYDAWHVRVEYPSGDYVDYWIDSDNWFRIYQCEGNGSRVRSIYNNDKYPWLPSEVILEIPELAIVETVVILDAVVRSNGFPSNHWELSSMDIPVGTEIEDYTAQRMIGYWNGADISVDFIPKVEKSSKSNNTTVYFVLIVSALLLPIAWFGIAYGKKKRIKTHKHNW